MKEVVSLVGVNRGFDQVGCYRRESGSMLLLRILGRVLWMSGRSWIFEVVQGHPINRPARKRKEYVVIRIQSIEIFIK